MLTAFPISINCFYVKYSSQQLQDTQRNSNNNAPYHAVNKTVEIHESSPPMDSNQYINNEKKSDETKESIFVYIFYATQTQNNHN